MTQAAQNPEWFLDYAELESMLERIGQANEAGLMRDYGTTSPMLRPKENLARLAWYRELSFQLARLTSGWISTASSFRLKMDLGRQAWLFTEVIAALDARLQELPGQPGPVDKSGRLADLRRALARARNEDEFLVAVYSVVVSRLLLAVVEHLGQCDPLADWPTRDRLERVAQLLKGQLAWASQYTDAHAKRAEPGELERWCRYVAESFEACGGVHGSTSSSARPAHPFAEQALLDACAEPSRLEPGFNVTDAFMMAEPRVTAGSLADILFHNWAELIVPEGLGYMVYDVEGMPYEFYRDFIRQIWDECRHTEMGKRELEQLGVDVQALPMNRLTRPPTYTEMLCVIGFTGEACSFPRKFDSVAAFYRHDRHSAGLVTEYDIVDEHDHVFNIRRWLPKLHENEGVELALEEVIKKIQVEALERWAKARTSPVKNASRALQSVGKFGAFCRELDFELNFDRVLSGDGPVPPPS